MWNIYFESQFTSISLLKYNSTQRKITITLVMFLIVLFDKLSGFLNQYCKSHKPEPQFFLLTQCWDLKKVLKQVISHPGNYEYVKYTWTSAIVYNVNKFYQVLNNLYNSENYFSHDTIQPCFFIILSTIYNRHWDSDGIPVQPFHLHILTLLTFQIAVLLAFSFHLKWQDFKATPLILNSTNFLSTK